MTPSRLLVSTLGVALALGAAGCGKDNLVPASWANEARSVPMHEVPHEGDAGELVANYVQEGEADRDPLTSLSYEEGLSEVTLELEAGEYELVEAVSLTADEVTITGAGSHNTRVLLDCESATSILIQGAHKVTVRDVTLVGLSGGGIRLRDCAELVLENVTVVGAYFGFDAEDATTTVRDCVFAGCEKGLVQDGGEVSIADTCFAQNWIALQGRTTLTLEACAFVENQTAVDVRVDARSKILSCLFAGERQDLAWTGTPGEARDNLAALRDVGARLGRRTNLPINHFQEFPTGLAHGMPLGFELARVHLAIQRWLLRGERDPVQALDDFREDQALRYGIASQQALTSEELEKAKRAARLGLAYWGERPLSEAPEELINVAELGQPD